MTAELIVSISGIRDRTLGAADRFCEDLDNRGIPVSLLVAPRLKGGYRLEHDPRTVGWLAERRAAGKPTTLQ